MEKKITALEPQKHNPSRINVFLDGEFAFGISRFAGAWLTIGQTIDEKKTQSLIHEDKIEQAYQSSLKYIAYKQRTETEVQTKLEELNYSQDIIDQVISELLEKGYVNDAEFAVQWIESRANSNPRSKRLIQYELTSKGIPQDIIINAIQAAPDDLDTAIQLGKKYINRFSSLDLCEFRKKMTGVLSRRAYSYPVVRDAIETLIELRKFVNRKNEV